MLYLQNKREYQVLKVPKAGIIPAGQLVFQAKSTIGLETEVSQDVTDTADSNLYFFISVAIPSGVPDGEYEYNLLAGGQSVAAGLLVIGDQATPPSQYNKTISYEQYNAG